MNKKMEMVRHKTPVKNITTGLQVEMRFFEKGKIVFFRKKNCLLIISPVIDVIELTFFEMHEVKIAILIKWLRILVGVRDHPLGVRHPRGCKYTTAGVRHFTPS